MITKLLSSANVSCLSVCVVLSSLMGCGSAERTSSLKSAQSDLFASRDLVVNKAKLGQHCRTHEACEAGQACIQQKCTLMDHVTCTTDLNCPEYEKCFQGVCAMCASDVDCRKGFACNYAGLCLPKDRTLIQCTQSSECSAGEVCFMGDCTPFGSDVMECQTKLHPLADASCAKENHVLSGLCLDLKKCDSDEQCHSGYRCYMKNCERIYCHDNADCGSSEICVDGACYERCVHNLDCFGGRCVDGICELTGECHSDNDCSEGHYCYVKEEIDYPYDERDRDSNKTGMQITPSRVYYSKENQSKCVACLNDSHCTGNDHCIQHECKPYACSKNVDCGEGRFCTSAHVCETLAKPCPSSEAEGDLGAEGVCGKQESCEQGYCLQRIGRLPTCAEDRDCRSVGHGVCNPVKMNVGGIGFKTTYQNYCAVGCMVDADCPHGLYGIRNICRNGVCTSGMTHHYCAIDADCSRGMKCNTLYGECVGDEEIEKTRRESGFGTSIGGSTVSCWNDADCHGKRCLASGVCGCIDELPCKE